MGTRSILKSRMAAAVVSAPIAWCVPAHATTFTFADEYYVQTQTQFNTAFGVGTTGFAGAGLYQKTTATAATELHANASSSYQPVPGEFVQNTNTAIDLTNWNHNFFGTLPQAVNNGGSSVTGPNNNLSGTGNPSTANASNSPVIQYFTGITGVNASAGTFTGGQATAFNLNSIDFNSNVFAIGAIIEGLLGGTVEDTFTGSINTSGLWQTHTFNWTDIDEVLFVYAGSQGALSIRNINIGPVATTPLPAALPLFGAGLGVIGLFEWRRKRKSAALAA